MRLDLDRDMTWASPGLSPGQVALFLLHSIMQIYLDLTWTETSPGLSPGQVALFAFSE